MKMLKKSYVELDAIPSDVFKTYGKFKDFIISEYPCEQLQNEVARNTRDDYCELGTARRIFYIFRREIHQKIDINKAMHWPPKNDNYVDLLIFMMTTEFINKVQNEIYNKHEKLIKKNLDRNLCEIISGAENY